MYEIRPPEPIDGGHLITLWPDRYPARQLGHSIKGLRKPGGIVVRVWLDPDTHEQGVFGVLSDEPANGGGHELDFVFGVGVEPLVDLLVEVLDRFESEFGDKGFDVDRARAGCVGGAVPVFFVDFSLSELADFGLGGIVVMVAAEHVIGFDGGQFIQIVTFFMRDRDGGFEKVVVVGRHGETPAGIGERRCRALGPVHRRPMHLKAGGSKSVTRQAGGL